MPSSLSLAPSMSGRLSLGAPADETGSREQVDRTDRQEQQPGEVDPVGLVLQALAVEWSSCELAFDSPRST